MSPTGIYWILSFAVLARANSQQWSEQACENKFADCSSMVNSGENDCDFYNQTIHCLDIYLDNCISQSLHATLARNSIINNNYCPDGCASELTLQECINSFFPPPPPSPSPPPQPDCSYTPSLSPPPFLPQLEPVSLSHPSPSPQCTPPAHETHYKQHCSIFSLSHLRPFSDRGLPLQTCTLYGSVYLLKHRSLSVSINGDYKIGTVGFYTDITAVNVTLHNHSCFPQSFTYRATVTELPEVSSRPGLQLSVNKTVATIIAPWINTTIIIYRTNNHLSVSLQVPLHISQANQVTGLCNEGCPNFRVEDSVLDLPNYVCMNNRANVSMQCLSLGLSIPPVGSVTYTDVCVYDILKTHDFKLLSLYSALNQATNLLPDVTEIVTPPPTQPPTTAASPETTHPTKHPQAVSSIVIMPPTEGGLVSRTLSTHPLFSLTLLCLLISLLLR